MGGMTRTEAGKIFTMLVAAFPASRLRDGTSDIYETLLLDLDYELVNRAISALILTEPDYMPSIAKIRAMAVTMRDGRRLTAGDAWGEVRRAISSKGSRRVPGVDFVFSDPTILRCVRALGWAELCASDMQTSDRARFIEMFEAVGAEDDRDRQTAGLLPAPHVREAPRLGGAQTMKQLLGAVTDAAPWEDDDV